MFAELIFASFIAAAGGSDAVAQVASPEPAIVERVNDSRPAAGGKLRLAADLGCPRHYDRRRGYDPRCHRRHADPYHENDHDRYGREDRYPDRGPDGYYDERHGGGNGYRGDTLRDSRGRPYPEARDRGDVPPYRGGAYEEPRGGYSAGPPRRPEPGGYHGYRERGEPGGYGPRRSGSYQSSSYRAPAYKKKDTRSTVIVMTTTRTVDCAAGSTA